MTGPTFPLAVLAELTHRRPLQCPYCYNPQTLERAGREMDTAVWLRTIEEVAGLGALCRSCGRREIDWGGCRCQAFALTGHARNTDPACAFSPDHEMILAIAVGESSAAVPVRAPPGPVRLRRVN